MDLSTYMEKVKDAKCLVVGDIILDKYISGSVKRISPEAPIPVVQIEKEWRVLGGAANVACNIAGCKAGTILCGVLGQDSHGDEVLQELEKKQIAFYGIRTKERMTTTKTRVVGPNQQIVRLDEEMAGPIPEQEEETLFEQIMECLPEVNVVVISDYNKGACTESICSRLIQEAGKRNVFVLVDPKATDWAKYSHAGLITPNFKEYCEALGNEVENEEQAILQDGRQILDKYCLGGILVTRSQHGMTFLNQDLQSFSIATKAQEVYDVSGAGDTVIAVIAAFLSAGYPLEHAIKISNYAAAISVSKKGTYVVSINEIINLLEETSMDSASKIVSWEELEHIVRHWKKNGEKVIFTNGCFDILHRGHVTYLNAARRRGNHLIVGLNTDRSVKALKGPSRPINNQEDRALVLSSLECVDKVILFDEDTPYNLIQRIRPDELVKGGDYKADEVVGGEFAGKVVIIPAVNGYSTTGLIHKKMPDGSNL